jgi:transcriptional regulator with XRE-family HTH domain
MATFHDFGSESLQDVVARRLRGLLAEVRLTKTEFAAQLGWDRGYLYRRLSGETPLNINDLELIEKAARIRADYLVGGHEPKLNPPEPPPGGGKVRPLPKPQAGRAKKGKPTGLYRVDAVAA